MKAKPLTKHTALDYLERRQGKAATAKELAIDLDTRASTASELLERMTAQGLVERDQRQRPREYVLTDAGRKRLDFFRSRAESNRDPESAVDPESNPGSEEEPGQMEPGNLDELRREVAEQFEGLRKDMGELLEFLNLRPARGEGRRERLERIKQRLETLANQDKANAHGEAVRKLYRAHCKLRSLSWPDSKEEAKARLADLEGTVGKETAEQIARLVELEVHICTPGHLWGDLVAVQREILDLREALHLPGNIFFGCGSESGEASAAEE